MMIAAGGEFFRAPMRRRKLGVPERGEVWQVDFDRLIVKFASIRRFETGYEAPKGVGGILRASLRASPGVAASLSRRIKTHFSGNT